MPKHRRSNIMNDSIRFRDEVVHLLASVGLATIVAEGVVVHPAAARYRPSVRDVSATTRAKRRLGADPQETQDPLFTDETGEMT